MSRGTHNNQMEGKDMKYGVYVLRGTKVDTRMIANYTENGYEDFVLVATANTKKEAKKIFDSLDGNFWN